MLRIKKNWLISLVSFFLLTILASSLVYAAREYNATGVYFQGGSGDGWDYDTGSFPMFLGGADDGWGSGASSEDVYLGFSTADHLIYTTQPTNSVRNITLTNSPVLEIRDASSNLVANSTASVTIALLNNPSEATLGGTLTKNASAGVITFNDLTINQYGSGYTLSASSAGITSAISNGFNVSYGTPVKLSVVTQPSSSYAGLAFDTQPIVNVLDSADNIVENATNTVAFAIQTDPPGSSTLSGTTSMSASSGVANFSGKGLKINRAGTGYVLQATSEGLTAGNSSVFNILSPIEVTSPNGDEVWMVSTDHDITWTTHGPLATGTNTVAYSLNEGSSWTTLTTNGTSPLSWVTPATASTQALVKVTNSADASFTDTSDQTFKLAGGFTVLVPNGGEVWANGYDHTIYWSTTGTVTNVKLEYYNGSDWTTITASTANNNQYTWQPNLDAGGTGFKIRITDASDSDVTDQSDSTFTLQRIGITAPTSGQRIKAGTSTNITWGSQGVTTVKIEYSLNDGAWTEITPSVAAAGGTYAWPVPSDFTTSSNVKIKISSTTADSDSNTASSTSSSFTVYGELSLTAPNGSEQWSANSPHDITWSTLAGTVTNVKLEYSSDNFVSDVNVITPSTSNMGTYSWTPTTTGTTFKVRISDAQDSEVSDTSSNYFTVTGIGITSPTSGVTWNCGSTQTITWNSTGVFANVKLEYYNGSSWSTIVASTPNTGSYSWPVSTSPSSSAKVRVSDAADSDPVGTSSTFNVKAPIVVTAPNGGESYTVGESATITWTNTGTINTVDLEYYNGSAWVSIAENVSNTTPGSGGSYSWAVDDGITSSALIRVSDSDSGHPSSNDSSNATFTIKGGFTVTAPTTGNTWGVSEAHNITWTTSGTVNEIRLYYATSNDDYASWTEITSGATANGNTYAWTVADAIVGLGIDPQVSPSLNLKIKVVDAVSGHPSASGTSNAFTITYYTITFSVTDSLSGSNLSALSVSCSSGWSASSLTSGVNTNHNYKYGSYQATWVKNDYVDTSASFTADSAKTVAIVMQLAAIAAQEYHVYSNFTYDSTTGGFIINTWMERLGAIVTDPTSCSISVYDKDGTQIDLSSPFADGNKSLTSSSPNAKGVFRQEWDVTGNPNLSADTTYLAYVTIVYGTTTYSSNVIYNIAIPKVSQLNTISTNVDNINTSVGSNLTGQVTTVQSGVSSLQTELASVKSTVSNINTSVGSNLTGQLSTVSSNVSDVKTSVGDNLSSTVGTINSDVSTVKTNVSSIVTAVGAGESTTLYSKVGSVLDDTTTNIPNTIVSELKKGVRSAILNRPTTVTAGASEKISFRTDSGLAPKITIYDPNNVTRVNSASMTEIGTTGIYEYQATFDSAWGTGDYTIVCSEPTLASTDSIIISVEETGALGQLSITLDSITSSISSLNTNINTINNLIGSTSDSSSASTLYGKLAAVNTNTTSMIDKWGSYKAKDIVDNVNLVSAQIGTPNDASGQRTVFGKVAEVYNKTDKILPGAEKIMDLYNKVETIKKNMETEGKSEKTLDNLKELKKTVDNIKETIDKLYSASKDKDLETISQAVGEVRKDLGQIAQDKGVGSRVVDQAKGANTLDSLSKQVAELKATLEKVRAAVEKENVKVESWLEHK